MWQEDKIGLRGSGNKRSINRYMPGGEYRVYKHRNTYIVSILGEVSGPNGTRAALVDT